MDSEIGLSQGTRRDAAQRFEDFPGENPSRGSIERWGREAMSKMTTDMKAVVRNRVPAKLQLDTEPFNYSSLPALPADANDTQKSNRAFALAKHDSDNASKAKYGGAQALPDEAGQGAVRRRRGSTARPRVPGGRLRPHRHLPD